MTAGSVALHADIAAGAAATARAFVNARRECRALSAFPGDIPADLVSAYRLQDMAIAEWPDLVVGWKVGFIAPDRRDASGDERLLGPIFATQLQHGGDAAHRFPVFAGGFGAVEAEYVLQLTADAPVNCFDCTPEEASRVPARLFIGVEIASSPLATINQLGPRVVVSDFGNNNGLVLGEEIPHWGELAMSALHAETFIDGVSVGVGGAAHLPGGLLAAYAFALSRSARRGRRLRAGDLIATGNATGIHEVHPGQAVDIRFGAHGSVHGEVVVATTRKQSGHA